MDLRYGHYWNDLTEAYQRIGLATETVTQADENLKVNRANYRAGLNLLDAQRLSQQASSELAEAQTDFQIKLSMYKYLTNTK